MSAYSLTKARIIQYIGILLALGLIAVGYWYFSASAGVKKNTATSQPQGTGRLDSGLVGYWKLDENTGTSAADSSTNGNTGTLTNGPTWTTGQIGSAVTFDGTNDYIDVGTPAVLDIGDQPFTVSAWVKTGITNTDQIIFSSGAADCCGSELTLKFDYNLGGGFYEFALGTSGVSDLNSNISGDIQTGTWYHVVGLWDGATRKIYVNGVLSASDSVSSLTAEYNNIVHIGAGDTTFPQYMNGQIDEVRAYDRAFSDDEVGQLYRLTAPTAVDTSLKGYWSFNAQDMNGTTAYDRSGAGNNGTLTNGPTKVVGRVGQAINFDGSNDFVEAGSAASLDNLANKSGCAWIYPQSGNPLGTIMSKSSTVGWEFSVKHNSGSPHLELYTTFSGTDGSWDSPANSVKYNTWQYVCFIYNNAATSNIPTFYIDGIATSVTTGSTPTGTVDSDASENFEIGVLGGSAEQFTGKIDEVRILNRILTAAEIKGLYDAGNPDKANTSAAQSQGTGRLDSGLVAYYPLDNGSGTTATDASVNGNNGTLTNGPLWVTGQVSGAVDFDGVDDYIQKTDTAIQDFGDTDNFTLAGWFSRDTATTDDVVLAKRTSIVAASAGYIVYLDATTDQLIFEVSDGTDEYSLTSTATFTSGSKTGWHHFSVVWDQDSPANSEIYIDGVADNATDTGTIGNVGDLSNAVSLGIGVNSLANNPFDGKIDEIRIYDRALSVDEIGQLYRLAAPTSVESGIRGYWSFNGQDIENTTAYDRSGARNTGTLTNGPVKTVGVVGQGIDFDGSNDYVSVADSSVIDGFSDLTFSGWFYRDTSTTDDTIIAKKASSTITDPGYILYLDATTDQLIFKISDGTNEYSLTSKSTFTATGWNFFSLSWASTGPANSRMYINGVDNEATHNSGTWSISNDPSNALVLAIGAESDAGGPFDGKLDEIRLYTGILTAAQSKAQYDLGAPDKGNTSASQPQGTGRLDSDLAGYWKLDENTGTSAADSSTNGNTGTLTNGPTWTTGQIGSGVQFDGTNDYISAGSDPSLVFTDRRTIAAWVYITGSMVNGNEYYIARKFSSGDSNSYYGMTLFHNGTGIKLGSYGGGGGAYVYSNGYLTANQWYHVAVAFDKPTITFYINGKLDSTGTDAVGGGYPSGSGTMYLGSAGGSSYLNGRLDEVRVYGHPLSADEIGQLYRLSAPSGTDTSLKGYWSFNGQDVSGTTAFDRSGAGNNGTLTNGTAKGIGKLGQALSFDGTDDYVEVVANSNLTVTNYTFAFWVKGNAAPGTGSITQPINKLSNPADGNSTLNFSWDHTTSTFKQACAASNGSWNVAQISTPLLANIWYHIVCTYDGSSLKAYLDGSLQATTAVSSVTTGSAPFRIGAGAGAGSPTAYFPGKIDEVRVYNRTLTATEIQNLYNQTK